MQRTSDLADLQQQLRQFAAERDWERFHSPKNLAMALACEAGEVLEHFQWLSESESDSLSAEAKQAVGEELADVYLYLVRLADRLSIDLPAAAQQKIDLNAKKYPVERAKGNAKKYTTFGIEGEE
ncbi:nucleotide pyrophosphohydrolase [Ramlibacter henchirensis]|nr:nucleotide pyrophosphohydrolase [Ramlibacter henchirensis]